MQGLADRTQGELTVLGVATRDPREATASFAADHDVTMPTLYDPDQKFAIAIKQAALPATVFVDADGEVYVHREPFDVDSLIEAVRERAERREQSERERRERNRRRPHTLAQGQNVTSLLLAPDETYAVMTVSEPGGGKNTSVPSFVNESAYTEDLNARTKVGDTQGRTRVALVTIETGDVKWVEIDNHDDLARGREIACQY